MTKVVAETGVTIRPQRDEFTTVEHNLTAQSLLVHGRKGIVIVFRNVQKRRVIMESRNHASELVGLDREDLEAAAADGTEIGWQRTVEVIVVEIQ